MKVKVAAEDRDERDAWIEDLVARSGAAQIQRVGHVLTIYRPSREKPQITLPR